jgi:Tol biopolymer transport system component
MKTKICFAIFICLFLLTSASASEVMQLTDWTETVVFPYWSFDGEYIVYVSITPYDTEFDMQLWIMDADGSNKTQFLNETGVPLFISSNPLSPNGNLLLYISNATGNHELWVMDTENMDRRQLTEGAHLENYLPGSENWKASWSPDGSQVIYVSAVTKNKNLWKIVETPGGKKLLMFDLLNASQDSNIWVIDTDGTNNRRLTDDGRQNKEPEWHPVGKMFAFSSNTTGDGGIWLASTDSSDKKQIAEGPVHSISWSPDGAKISYVKIDRENLSSSIWVMDADGNNDTLVVNNPGYFKYHSYPEWSPDSTKIVYVEDNRDNSISEIYIVNIDGTGQTKIGNGMVPKWSLKGDRIVFVASKNENAGISVIILDEKWRSAPAETKASLPDIPQENGTKSPGFTVSFVMMAFLIAFVFQKRK